jgi:hypothetical protein
MSQENSDSWRCSQLQRQQWDFAQEIVKRLKRFEWMFACSVDAFVISEDFRAGWIKRGEDIFCITCNGQWDAVRVSAVGESVGEHDPAMTSCLRIGI